MSDRSKNQSGLPVAGRPGRAARSRPQSARPPAPPLSGRRPRRAARRAAAPDRNPAALANSRSAAPAPSRLSALKSGRGDASPCPIVSLLVEKSQDQAASLAQLLCALLTGRASAPPPGTTSARSRVTRGPPRRARREQQTKSQQQLGGVHERGVQRSPLVPPTWRTSTSAGNSVTLGSSTHPPAWRGQNQHHRDQVSGTDQRARTRRRRRPCRDVRRACAFRPRASVSSIAHVVDDQDRRGQRPDRHACPKRQRRDRSELHERGPTHRDEAEEQHHKHVAKPVISQRIGATRVGDGGGDRAQADDDDRQARNAGQVDPDEQARAQTPGASRGAPRAR